LDSEPPPVWRGFLMNTRPAARPAPASGPIRVAGESRPWELRSRDSRFLLGWLTQAEAEKLVLTEHGAQVVRGRDGTYLRAVVSRNAEPVVVRYAAPNTTERISLEGSIGPLIQYRGEKDDGSVPVEPTSTKVAAYRSGGREGHPVLQPNQIQRAKDWATKMGLHPLRSKPNLPPAL
jgi:hypothetical protein